MYRTAAASSEHLYRYDALIARSKAYWTWPDGYLEKALELLRITQDYLGHSDAFEILRGSELVGFCAVLSEADRITLDHLWIEPSCIGHGAGAFAVSYVIDLTRRAGRSAIDVWPDPPAEPFYLRQGFKATCDQLPSRIPCGPSFRRFRFLMRDDVHPSPEG